MFGKASSERVVEMLFPNHLYGVSGDRADHSDTRINRTSTQVFWVEILGGGWTVTLHRHSRMTGIRIRRKFR